MHTQMHCSIYSSKLKSTLHFALVKNPENQLGRGHIHRGEVHISKKQKFVCLN